MRTPDPTNDPGLPIMQRREDYAYDLPKDRIAQSPAESRDASRLLVLHRDGIDHASFRDLGRYLRAGDLLVLNDTRVVPARLACRRGSGARVDAVLLGSADGNGTLDAMLRCNARLVPGETLSVDGSPGRLVLLEKRDRGRWSLVLEGATLHELMEEAGRAPLPPYIRRPSSRAPQDALDLDRYQTIFARADGAVAAPTAGLHFSEEVFADLARRGVGTAYVTLHVGPGTFLPVRCDDIAEHRMQAERYRIGPGVAERIRDTRRAGGRIVAVGTTTCRTLEAARPGLEDGRLSGETDLFIRPGYRFREIDVLLTNFHMPESTLLMLVAAFAGRERVLDAYRVAVAEGYRFYSYGDAMLVFP